MTFTYDGTLDTTLELVRLEIGDTDSAAPLFTDAEINVKLAARADNVLSTAADLCDILATRFARAYDFETDGQKFARSQMSKQYAALSKVLRGRAAGGAASVTVTRVDGYSQTVTSRDVDPVPAVGRVRRGYYPPDVLPG